MKQPGTVSGEEDLIQGFLAPLSAGYPGAFGLRDDCAVIEPKPGYDLVIKTDPIAEGVHFFPDDDPADIAWKALAVNVSDLAAKGARPRVYLLALAFPSAPARAWMERFAAGLAEAQGAFGMHLIGGDTDRRAGPLSITPTVLGDVPAGRMVRRGAAKPGDFMYVSGTLGDAALGLALRQSPERAHGWKLPEESARVLVARYLRPEPRLGLRPAVLEYARAAMDISDGLAKDLGRMCKASGVGASARVELLPISGEARSVLNAAPDMLQLIVSGGDDYEVLAAVPPELGANFEAACMPTGIGVRRIGVFLHGEDVAIVSPDGTPISLAHTGYDHFPDPARQNS